MAHRDALSSVRAPRVRPGHAALEDGTITEDERFSLHDLKRKGITDYKGTRHEKQEGSGHRSPGMMDVYDLSLPVVKSSEE